MSNSKRKCKLKSCGIYTKDFLKQPAGVFCCEDHMFKFIAENQEKAREKRLRHIKSEEKKTKKANRKARIELDRKTLKWQHKQTQPVFNKLRRLQEFKWFQDRDIEPYCICCQQPLGNDQWCNGHFKTVGANSRLRYDFKNSFLQRNQYCNMRKSGNIAGYKEGLIYRFGEEEGQAIIDYCETNNAPIKWHWQELEEMRFDFLEKIKTLEKLLTLT